MYFILASLLIVLSILELIDRSLLYKKTALFIAAFCMVLFAGLRYEVGTDWDAYFINYKLFYWETEWGYKYINLFFSKILEAPFNVFLLLYNAVSIFLIAKYIKHLSGYYLIAVLIFYSDLFMYYNLSGMRQAMATSFTCLALIFGVRKKLNLFLLFTVIAALFHVTALVFLFAYFIPRKSLRFKHILLIAVGFISVVYLSVNFVGSIEYLAQKAEYYTEIQENASDLPTLLAIGIAKRSIIIIIFLLLFKKLKNVLNMPYFFNLYLIGFIIYVCLYMISPDFGVRFSSYYTILDCILVGSIIYHVPSKRIKFSVLILFCALSLYKVSVYAAEKTYQYKTILEK